jgi:hypothetical protein
MINLVSKFELHEMLWCCKEVIRFQLHEVIGIWDTRHMHISGEWSKRDDPILHGRCVLQLNKDKVPPKSPLFADETAPTLAEAVAVACDRLNLKLGVRERIAEAEAKLDLTRVAEFALIVASRSTQPIAVKAMRERVRRALVNGWNGERCVACGEPLQDKKRNPILLSIHLAQAHPEFADVLKAAA